MLCGLSVYRSAVDLRLFVLRHGAAQPERNEGGQVANTLLHIRIMVFCVRRLIMVTDE